MIASTTIDPEMIARARKLSKYGTYSGFLQSAEDARYMRRCTHVDLARGLQCIFTRSSGMHSCGWWKNSDYERCEHLSISFFEPTSSLAIGVPKRLPYDRQRGAQIAKEFFRENVRLLWVEPPYSETGKLLDVYHYRLFCDPSWAPILPRGEVYNRENTPAEWRSWSDVHDDDAQVRADDGAHS